MGISEIVVMVGQLLLALAILVGLHEAGHMFAAKAFGMKVEKFSIGFPPKLFSFKYKDTEYSLGLIPLGGFVKIAGMVDESLDTKDLDKPAEPWEFRAKPAYQRLIVMLGGIIVNVITGVLVYIFVTFAWGDVVTPLDQVKDGVDVTEKAEKLLGIKTGDKLLEVGGKKWEDYSSFSEINSNADLLLGDEAKLKVSRRLSNGKDSVFTLKIPSNVLNEYGGHHLFEARFKFEVAAVSKSFDWSPWIKRDYLAEKINLKKGDKILKVNDFNITYFDELKSALGKNKGDSVRLEILREGKTLTFNGILDPSGKIGIAPKPLIKQDTVYYGFGKSISLGTSRAFGIIYNNIRGFGKMFSGDLDPRKSVGGPVKIAQLFGTKWSWHRFWTMTGMLSMVLAFMNILPIPALDGGHVMFLLFEMVSGRKPSDKFMEIALKVGMVILLSIMAFAFLNDFGLFS